MATALDLIKRSLRQIHVLDVDEEPSASEAQDSLSAMNDMLDSWSIDKAYIYALNEATYTWAANEQSRTIGSGGDFNGTRPVTIHNSTFYRNIHGDDYPLNLLETRRGYTSILDKETTTDLPRHLYYEPNYPLGTLYMWPVPSPAITLYLHSWESVSQIASLTTTVDVPPGYKEGIQATLSMRLASEFGVAVPPETADLARRATRNIKKKNRKTPVSRLDTANLHDRRSFNVYSGE